MRRPDDRAVLLPTTGRRRRRRTRGRLSRAIWIASAVLVGGLAAIALEDSAWLEELVDGPDPHRASEEAPSGPYGPGKLGLPPPDGTSRPPPPP